MRRVRIGNDFIYLMPVVRDGELEDLTVARNLKLICNVGSSSSEIPFELIGTHTLRIEVTTEIASRLGVYNFEVSYELEDLSLADKSLEVAQDKDVFWIVAKTAHADEVSELTGVIDVSIGLRGKAFEYEDFTPAQLEEIKRPAVEAAAVANEAARVAGVKAQLAQDEASNAREATANANSKINEINSMLNDWQQVESLIVEEELSRVQAELRRDQKEAAMDAAEQIRMQNDLERIGSVAGTKEYNEINIQ